MNSKNSLIFLLLNAMAFGQYEVLNPVMTNPELNVRYEAKPLSRTPDTFDSTFFYISDKTTFPFFDDFSSNKFQKYNAEPTDPNVTEEEYYRMLTPLTGLPLSGKDTVLATIQTYLRRIDVTNGTSTDSLFLPIAVDYSDLKNYPVVYNRGNYYPAYYIMDTTQSSKRSN